MVLALHSYHSAPRSPAERTAKRIAILVAIAGHLLFFLWVLQRHPDAHETHDSAMLLVDVKTVRNQHQHDALKFLPLKTKGAQTMKRDRVNRSPTPPVSNLRVADAVRPSITEGTLRPADDDGAVSTWAANNGLSGNGVGVHGGGSTDDSGSIEHPHFRVPKVVHRWIGEYPRSAIASKEQGIAYVLVTIDAEGHLVRATISKSSGSTVLDAATLDAIQHYVFRAGERNGIPETMDAYISLSWTIDDPIIEHFKMGGDTQRDVAAHGMVSGLPKNFSPTKVEMRFGPSLIIKEEDRQKVDQH